MINVNELTTQLRMLPDQALQRMAMMYKNDPYIFPMVISEDMARKKMRQAAQAQGQVPQMKVADQAIMAMGEQPQQAAPGIAALQAPNMQNMADGGIAGYDDAEGYAGGGEVMMPPGATPSYQRTAMSPGMLDFAQRSEPVVRMARGGGATSGKTLFEQALEMEGVTDPTEIAFLRAIHLQESTGGKTAKTSNRGAVGPMQILPSTFASVADKDMDISKPLDNMRAGIRYARQGYRAANKDPELAGAFYYGGPGGMEKAAKRIPVSDPRNPDAPNTIQYGKQIAQRMTQLLPMSAAVAEERPAATPGRAEIPGTMPSAPREEKPRTVGERAVGAGETALSFLSGIPALALGAGRTALESISRREAPTEEQYAENVGRFVYGPRTEAGQEYTEETGRFLTQDLKLPPYVSGATVPVRGAGQYRSASDRARAAAEAAAAAEGRLQTPRLPPPSVERMTPQQIEAAISKVETPRLPVPGATPEQESAGLAALMRDREAAAAARRNPVEAAASEAAQRRALAAAAEERSAAQAARARATAQAEEAARAGATLQRGAEEAAYAGDVGRRASAVGAAATVPGTAEPRPIVSDTPPPAVVPKDLTPKEQDKVIKAAKNAVDNPEAAEGWTKDDWLTLGFSLLANRSPYFTEALGTAGLQTLAGKQAREKAKEDKELRKAQIDKLKAEASYISETKAKSALYNRAVQLAKAQISALKSSPQAAGMTPEQLEEQATAITRRIYNDLLKQEGFGGEVEAAAPAQGAIPSTPPPGAVKRIG